jgi:hypothetical protein
VRDSRCTEKSDFELTTLNLKRNDFKIMKKYYYFLPLLLLISCISLEEHANNLQQNLRLIDFEYKEFICEFKAYAKADCYVSKPSGEIIIFTCDDGNCYLDLNNDEGRVKRVK